MSIKAANFVLNSFSLFKIVSNEIDVTNNTSRIFKMFGGEDYDPMKYIGVYEEHPDMDELKKNSRDIESWCNQIKNTCGSEVINLWLLQFPRKSGTLFFITDRPLVLYVLNGNESVLLVSATVDSTAIPMMGSSSLIVDAGEEIAFINAGYDSKSAIILGATLC